MNTEQMNRIYRRIEESDKLLIGIGGEWKQNPDKKQIEHIIARPEVAKGYEALYQLIKERLVSNDLCGSGKRGFKSQCLCDPGGSG